MQPAPRTSSAVNGIETNLARFWFTRVEYGLLLGLAVATLNFAHYYPIAAGTHDLGTLAFLSLLPEWCGEGLLLALTVGLAERLVYPRELRAWQLTLAVACGAVVGVLVWQAFTLHVLRATLGIRLLRDFMEVPVTWLRGVFFHAWLMLFFGGLAAAVHATRRQRTRMLAALHAAELGRATAQRCFAHQRLAALHSNVEPDYLLQTLSRLGHAYDTDPAAADCLLDELIVFLRQAQSAIRAAAADGIPAPVHAGSVGRTAGASRLPFEPTLTEAS